MEDGWVRRCSQGAEKVEELPKFVVRTLNAIPQVESVKPRLEFDFHLVDLQKKEVELKYLPPISNGARFGTLLKLDSTIYILGDVDDGIRPLDKQQQHHIHMGSSKINVSSSFKCWEPFEVPYLTHMWSNPATISGKIYCFGSPQLRPKVRNLDSWKDLVLPKEFDVDVGRRVSEPVLPDPDNNRFIVHLFDEGQLYAFYPPKDECSTGQWDCLDSSFYNWYSAAAVADNVIYFHDWGMSNLVSAYDITTQKWLQVVGDFSKVGATVRLFHAIFTLPVKDVICLASGLTSKYMKHASVHFLSFRVKRISDTQIKLTALDYQHYDIPSAFNAYDFVMF